MTSPVATTPRATTSASRGLTLAIGMGLANVLSYACIVLVSRGLEPAVFGAFAAVNNLYLFVAIPAGAYQVVVARHVSRHQGQAPGAATGWGASLVLLLGLVALSPVLVRTLHLESPWPPIVLAISIFPVLMTGSLQGVLLGRGQLTRLSSTYVVGGLAKAAVGLAVYLTRPSLTFVFTGLVLAALATYAFTLALCPIPWSGHPLHVAQMLRASLTLAGLIALTNVDILLARHYLDAHDSGLYALAGFFGRGVFWGTQFLALISLRSASVTGNPRRALLRGCAVVLGIGGFAFLAMLAAPHFWIQVTGGAKYEGATDLLPWFVLLGTVWALIQVATLCEIGGRQNRVWAVTWLGTLGLTVIVVARWHESAEQVLAAALATSGVVALVALWVVWTGVGTARRVAP